MNHSNKTYQTNAEKIADLKHQKFNINNDDLQTINKFLNTVNYLRIIKYSEEYGNKNQHNLMSYNNKPLTDIIDIHDLDQELRNLFIAKIDIVELRIRHTFFNFFIKHVPDILSNSAHWQTGTHQDWLTRFMASHSNKGKTRSFLKPEQAPNPISDIFDFLDQEQQYQLIQDHQNLKNKSVGNVIRSFPRKERLGIAQLSHNVEKLLNTPINIIMIFLQYNQIKSLQELNLENVQFTDIKHLFNANDLAELARKTSIYLRYKDILFPKIKHIFKEHEIATLQHVMGQQNLEQYSLSDLTSYLSNAKIQEIFNYLSVLNKFADVSAQQAIPMLQKPAKQRIERYLEEEGLFYPDEVPFNKIIHLLTPDEQNSLSEFYGYVLKIRNQDLEEIIEELSFGQLCYLYSRISKERQIIMVQDFNFPENSRLVNDDEPHKHMNNLLFWIKKLRNKCCHFDKVYDLIIYEQATINKGQIRKNIRNLNNDLDLFLVNTRYQSLVDERLNVRINEILQQIDEIRMQ